MTKDERMARVGDAKTTGHRFRWRCCRGGPTMEAIRPLSVALAICCASGCNDKIAPWTAASAVQSSAIAPVVGPWTAAAAPIRSARCSLDAVNDQGAGQATRVDSGSPANFSGWVATVDLKNPRQFTLVLDGPGRDFGISAATSEARFDVAKALGSNALAYAGFRIDLPAHALQPGTYRVALAHRGATGDVICATPTTLTVR